MIVEINGLYETILLYSSDKYKASVNHLLEDAIYEYFSDERKELERPICKRGKE